VKWHISELLAETGLGDRRALAHWWEAERQEQRQLLLAPLVRLPRIALAAPLAAGLLVATLLLVFMRDNPESRPELSPVGPEIRHTPAPEARVEDPGPPDSCEPPEGLDLRIVTPEELMAEGLVRIGGLFDSKYCPVYVANRIDRAFVWVAGTADVDLRGPPGWTFDGATEKGVSFHQGLASPDSKLLEVIAVGLRSELSQAGMLIDQARGVAVTRPTTGEGGYLLIAMQDSGFRRVAVALNGELFASPGVPPDDLIVNEETGEQIDVSSMYRVASLPSAGRGRTECGAITCLAKMTIRGGASWPVSGQLRCPKESTSNIPGLRDFELDSGDFVLRFHSIDPNEIKPSGSASSAPSSSSIQRVQPSSSSAPAWTCEQKSVVAGDPMPVQSEVALLEIEARAGDGSSLSVVSSYGGTLYVGSVGLTHRCSLLQYC
jgi:hypothetical protein